MYERETERLKMGERVINYNMCCRIKTQEVVPGTPCIMPHAAGWFMQPTRRTDEDERQYDQD